MKRLTLPPRGAHAAARFFSADEARRIIAAAPEPYATIYALAALTGMRAGELLGLKVSDLMFAGAYTRPWALTREAIVDFFPSSQRRARRISRRACWRISPAHAQRKRSNSALTPGPNATISPYWP